MNEMKIWFGIDVSKSTFDASVFVTGSKMDISSIPKSSFKRTKEGVELFKSWAKEQIISLNFPSDSKYGAVMEATGSYSLALVSLLLEICPECSPSIADPKSVHAFGKSLRIRNKTDKTDAAILAIYGAERKPEKHEIMPVEYQILKELTRQRKSLVEMNTAANLKAKEESNVKIVNNVRNEVIRNLEKSIAKIELAIKKHINEYQSLKEQVSILASIPGVGLVIAAVMLGELGDMRRFSSSKKIAAFAGVSPRIYESGTSVKGRSKMCKEGQGRLRQALFLTAISSTRGDNGFSRFYAMLIIKGKTKMSALGAVMRKMICVMRRLIIDKALYNDSLVTPILSEGNC
jgi:transposase